MTKEEYKKQLENEIITLKKEIIRIHKNYEKYIENLIHFAKTGQISWSDIYYRKKNKNN